MEEGSVAEMEEGIVNEMEEGIVNEMEMDIVNEIEEGSVNEMEEGSVNEIEEDSETSCTTTLAEITSRGECSNAPSLNGSSNEERNWNKSLELNIKAYLINEKYPTRCRRKEEKRSFRRKAQNFAVQDGKLCYKVVRNGCLLYKIALTSLEEQQRAFQVC